MRATAGTTTMSTTSRKLVRWSTVSAVRTWKRVAASRWSIVYKWSHHCDTSDVTIGRVASGGDWRISSISVIKMREISEIIINLYIIYLILNYESCVPATALCNYAMFAFSVLGVTRDTPENAFISVFIRRRVCSVHKMIAHHWSYE